MKKIICWIVIITTFILMINLPRGVANYQFPYKYMFDTSIGGSYNDVISTSLSGRFIL